MVHLGYDPAGTVPASDIRFPRDLVSCGMCDKTLVSDSEASFSRNLKIRLADTDVKRSEASLLINRMYDWRGYGSHHAIPATPSHLTFTALDCCRTIGTVTLAIDSASGIAADGLFRAEIDAVRAQPGARVCELTKLAFDASAPSKPMLAALFHVVFIYGYRQHRCTDLFIEVNPRHCRYYEAMLGFTRIGEVRHHEAVGAPAQLMWLKVDEIRRRVDRCKQGTNRSLYNHFFSPKEEDGVFSRMVSDREYPLH